MTILLWDGADFLLTRRTRQAGPDRIPIVELEFDVTVDESADEVRYTCRSCVVTEHGGPIGNPGLLHRMAAHGREGHQFPADRKFRGVVIDGGETTFRLVLESTDQPVETSSDEQSLRPSASPDDRRWMPERRLYREFIVDTNCVNARGGMSAMNKLERWSAQGVIRLLTTEVAQNEMLVGNDAQRTEKAYSFIFTMSEVTSSHEQRSLREIEAILFPDGADNQNKKNDVEIVFNAAKYMRPLITNDGGSKSQPGGILGNRTRLAQRGISVLTPDEAVALVQREIAARDKSARKMAEMTGGPLPERVGKD